MNIVPERLLPIKEVEEDREPPTAEEREALRCAIIRDALSHEVIIADRE